jgi:hypothetical protein
MFASSPFIVNSLLPVLALISFNTASSAGFMIVTFACPATLNSFPFREHVPPELSNLNVAIVVPFNGSNVTSGVSVSSFGKRWDLNSVVVIVPPLTAQCSGLTNVQPVTVICSAPPLVSPSIKPATIVTPVHVISASFFSNVMLFPADSAVASAKVNFAPVATFVPATNHEGAADADDTATTNMNTASTLTKPTLNFDNIRLPFQLSNAAHSARHISRTRTRVERIARSPLVQYFCDTAANRDGLFTIER